MFFMKIKICVVHACHSLPSDFELFFVEYGAGNLPQEMEATHQCTTLRPVSMNSLGPIHPYDCPSLFVLPDYLSMNSCCDFSLCRSSLALFLCLALSFSLFFVSLAFADHAIWSRLAQVLADRRQL